MREILTLIVFAGIFLVGCSSEASKNKNEITIGIQQTLSPLWIAKEKGWFEEAFKKEGISVKWAEFQSGPPQFEGLAANKLDFTQVGNTPVISGQAAGVKFKEIALAADGLKGQGLLVNKGSAITKIEDLKGKKIAVAKGSSAFGLLYKVLKEHQLQPTDVEIIQLQPDEGLPAFENGSVDVWAIWEPFVSIQTIQNEAEILANGETINAVSPSFTLARTELLEDYPEYVQLFLEVYEKTVNWQHENEEEAIAIYSTLRNLDPKIVKSVLNNTTALNEPITEEMIQAQQETADLLYELKAIDQKINTEEVVDNRWIKKIKKGE